ncbi:MAG: hypothetical protein ABEH43_03765, partial [Flavobacteriales bacterium]
PKWYSHKGIKYTVFIGFILGLISLIRPNNFLILIVFILWNVTSFKGIKKRISYFINSWDHILIMILCFLIICLPQFIYWKYITGEWLYYSYGDDRFYFTDPKIKGLFGYRKGFFIYTPIMFIAFIGIGFMKEKVKEFFGPVIIFTTINVYVLLSWWCWWYGGSFGQRAFIDSYGLWSLPLAAILSYGLSRKKVIKNIITYFVILTLTFHGIFQTLQYHYEGIARKS